MAESNPSQFKTYSYKLPNQLLIIALGSVLTLIATATCAPQTANYKRKTGLATEPQAPETSNQNVIYEFRRRLLIQNTTHLL